MDENTWLQQYQEETQQRLGLAQEIQEKLRESTGTAQSQDGAVRVTVGPTGALTNLELSPRAGQLTQVQLAQLILRTAREAHRQAGAQMQEAIRPLIGDSDAMAYLESQLPAPEDPAPPQPPAQGPQPPQNPPYQQRPPQPPQATPYQQRPPQPPQTPQRPQQPPPRRRSWDDDDNGPGPILR